MTLSQLSDKQIERLWQRILTRIHDDPELGYYETTLNFYRPALYRAYRDVRAEIRIRTNNPKWGETRVYA